MSFPFSHEFTIVGSSEYPPEELLANLRKLLRSHRINAISVEGGTVRFRTGLYPTFSMAGLDSGAVRLESKEGELVLEGSLRIEAFAGAAFALLTLGALVSLTSAGRLPWWVAILGVFPIGFLLWLRREFAVSAFEDLMAQLFTRYRQGAPPEPFE